MSKKQEFMVEWESESKAIAYFEDTHDIDEAYWE